jgi:hypothetical protein
MLANWQKAGHNVSVKKGNSYCGDERYPTHTERIKALEVAHEPHKTHPGFIYSALCAETHPDSFGLLQLVTVTTDADGWNRAGPPDHAKSVASAAIRVGRVLPLMAFAYDRFFEYVGRERTGWNTWRTSLDIECRQLHNWGVRLLRDQWVAKGMSDTVAADSEDADAKTQR